MEKINLSQIMKTAWQFFHTTGENFANCLKMAWRGTTKNMIKVKSWTD